MSARQRGSRQAELFARSTKAVIALEMNHRLVQLTHELDWTELEEIVEAIRARKLKNAAGRPPHLRALIGAVVFRSTRRITYRETEDQIRHYAPARYLCGLTETEWSPDANTIQDFEELLGEDGMKRLNDYVVTEAVEEKLADPTLLVADTTAQEAAIPYPNEMNLMAAFLTAIAVASKRAGGALKRFGTAMAAKFAAGRKRLRAFRLFAKEKSKQARMTWTSEMTDLVEDVQTHLARALQAAEPHKQRLIKYAKVAHAKTKQLHDAMSKLLPQIRYWIKTGFVAANKIISVHIPALYSIVRGKAGKKVEFGLQWGISRLGGGFLRARVASDRRELVDARYAVKAVDDHIALFGTAPKGYAYDRAGHSEENVALLKAKGVTYVGLAPRGQTKWAVRGAMKAKLVKERAQVEAGIGTVKHAKYGFTKPAARSAPAMAMCGQRAVLGFNLNKFVRGLAARRKMVLVG